MRVRFAKIQGVEQHVEIPLRFIHRKEVPEGARQQLADQKYFVGESGLGNDADIRVMRPEFVEQSANLVAARVRINLGGELQEVVRTHGRRHVEKGKQALVDPCGAVPGGTGIECQECINLRHGLRVLGWSLQVAGDGCQPSRAADGACPQVSDRGSIGWES